jgi:hypothetical protein
MLLIADTVWSFHTASDVFDTDAALGHPARLKEAREVGALPQLWDAQLHRFRPASPSHDSFDTGEHTASFLESVS